MKKNALLATLLLLTSLSLAACSGASKTESSLSDNGKPMASAPAASEDYAYSEAPAEKEMSGFADSSVSLDRGSSVYTNENAKIIRTASLYLQTTEFEQAAAALDGLVAEQGGYFENASVNTGSYYSKNTNRYGYYTIRIPKANFDRFLSAVGDVAHIVNRSIDSRNVGEDYYDAELRLATLQTKHERLLALLDEATLMEDIIKLESALTDVEYEIQHYTSTLDRYDALVDYSTVSVELQEVARVTDETDETDSLGVRLSGAFTEGWWSFVDGLSNLAVWFAYNFIGCIIFAAVLVVVVVVIRKRLPFSRRKKQAPPPSDDIQ